MRDFIYPIPLQAWDARRNGNWHSQLVQKHIQCSISRPSLRLVTKEYNKEAITQFVPLNQEQSSGGRWIKHPSLLALSYLLDSMILISFFVFSSPNHHSVLSTPLSCRGAGGESFSLPYILYNKVYSLSFRLLLSVLHSFFLFFLKNLSHSFAGLRKSHTFALAKREHLLRAKLEDVFVALRRKSSLTDFHRQKLQYKRHMLYMVEIQDY